MKKIFIACSAVLYLCASNHLITKKEQNFFKKHKIECVSTVTWEPFNTKIDNKPAGIGIDYWNLIKKRLDISADCKIVKKWSDVLDGIKKKKYDITVSTAKTTDKMKYALFSKPYVTFPIVIATKDNVGFISDIGLLKDKKIAVGKDYTAEHFLKKYYPDYNIVETSDIDQALQMLSQGKVFAVVDILPVIAYKINKYDYQNLKISGKTPWDFPVCFMVRKDYDLFVSAINKAIDSISKDEKYNIYKRWIKLNIKKDIYTKKDILPYLAVLMSLLLLMFIYAFYLKKDLKNRKHFEEELEKIATIDRLTKVFNRYKMDITLKKYIELSKRYNRKFSIIFFDIDHFKNFNDKYGHSAGDIVLQEICKIVSNSIRKSDIFGRWGGEEFLIILPETQGDEALRLAEKLRINIKNHTIKDIGMVTCSFGITQYKMGDSAKTILVRADINLYKAKELGRDRTEYS